MISLIVVEKECGFPQGSALLMIVLGGFMRINFFFARSGVISFRILKYLLLIFAVSFSILLIVYIVLTRNLEKQTCLKNLDIVKTGAENMENILGTQEKLAVFFEYSQNILSFFYRADPLAEGNTTSDMIAAQKSLNAMGIANSDILNIQMYSDRSGALIDYSACVLFPSRYYGGRFQLDGYDCNRWANEILADTEERSFVEAEMSFQGSTKRVLIYNRKFSNTGSGDGNNRIIFYTDIQNLKAGFKTTGHEEGFFSVMDSDGTVILSEHLSEERKYYLQNTEFEEEGYRRCKIGGRKMLLVNYQSDALGFNYILAVPYSGVRADVKPLISTMRYLVIFSGIVGVLFVIGMSAHFSRLMMKIHAILGTMEKDVSLEDFAEKLAEIVKGNEIMKEEMRRQLSFMQYESFKNVMIGNVTDKKEIRKTIEQSGIKKSAKYYVFLILSWNDLDDDINIEEISAQKVYTERLIRYMDKGEVEMTFQLDIGETIVLLAYDNGSLLEIRNRAEDLIMRIMEESVKNINYSISVSGDIIFDLESLSKSFFRAKKALSVSKNIFGNSPIQWYDMAKIYFKTIPQGEEEAYDSTHNIRVVEEIKKYIDAHFSDPGLSLVSIAEEFFITEAYASKLFKRISGQNFSKYIEKIRMENAKVLLEEGKTITEVSSLVGYNSPQVFRRAWKRFYSGLPSKRQNMKSDRREALDE